MEAPYDSTVLLFFPIAHPWNCRKLPYKTNEDGSPISVLLLLMTPLYIVAKRFFNLHFLHFLHLKRQTLGAGGVGSVGYFFVFPLLCARARGHRHLPLEK